MKYRDLVVEPSGIPLNLEDVRALEQDLGHALPADYRSFLTECNGGNLDYEIPISFADGTSEYLCFGALFPICGGEWETNPFELRQARMLPGFPGEGVLPIARDGGGSILFLDLRDGYRVMAFVHGLPAWTGRRENDALVPVAGSFDEYLNKLTISDEWAQGHIEEFIVTSDSVAASIEWLDSRHADWREKFRSMWNERVPDEPV